MHVLLLLTSDNLFNEFLLILTEKVLVDGFFKISNNLKASFNFLLDKGTPAFYIYMQMEFKDLKLPKESPDTYD